MRNMYSEDVYQYLFKNHRGKSSIDMSKKINQVFNLKTTSNTIQNLKSNLKRRRGWKFEKAINPGCKKKGSIPWNKGTKGLMVANAGSFKKGNIPANHRDIGSERLTVDGFWEVKIKDGCGKRNWIAKHRYIYEQHYGKIPKGYIVIFLDGNKNNFDIGNLKAISRHENLVMNSEKLRYQNKETTEVGTTLAKVIIASKKRNKDG